MAKVALRGVRKLYGSQVAIESVDLEIADGEFVAIVGPSGCGKSTLLRCVAGLETLSGGSIHIGERDVGGLEPGERNVAMVFQNYALYPHMTVFENMSYGLRIRRMPKSEIAARVDRAAGILGLGELLGRRPRELSGGQRQRVAMGRAIVREPKVFLFDEPLSNLDAKLRSQMRIELRKLHGRLATTSLYVTHDQVEAMTLANRIVVMNAGRAEQIGSPAEVHGRPASRFVAGFIGSPAMNIVRGRIDERGLALPDGGRIDLADPALRPWVGREVDIGMRPEHLRPGPTEGAAIVATVELVEMLGADTIVHARRGDTQFVARLHEGEAPALDQQVGLTPMAGTLHFFDPETGRRLEAGHREP